MSELGFEDLDEAFRNLQRQQSAPQSAGLPGVGLDTQLWLAALPSVSGSMASAIGIPTTTSESVSTALDRLARNGFATVTRRGQPGASDATFELTDRARET